MPLLSSSDQQKLREAFAGINRPVHLLFFTQTVGCETCPLTKQILDELPPLSDHIVIDEVNVVLDADKVKRFGIERAPAIAIAYEESPGAGLIDSRIRFLGAPSGYEFMSLIHAVALVGTGQSELSEASRQRLSSVNRPVTMQVFTTPT